MELTTILLPASLAVVLMLGTAALVARRRPDATVSHESDGAGGPHEETDAALEPIEVEGPEAGEVRVLRAQVRTLVTALEEAEQASVAPAVLLADGIPGASPEIAVYRRRVESTLRAMTRQLVEEDSSDRSFSRMMAAIDRLEGAGAVRRPVLAPAPAGASSALAGLRLVPAEAMSAPVVAPAAVSAPAEDTEDTEDVAAEQPAVAAAPPAREVVLPVPAPAAAPARGRRGRLLSRERVA